MPISKGQPLRLLNTAGKGYSGQNLGCGTACIRATQNASER
jgi:hypothetical protein